MDRDKEREKEREREIESWALGLGTGDQVFWPVLRKLSSLGPGAWMNCFNQARPRGPQIIARWCCKGAGTGHACGLSFPALARDTGAQLRARQTGEGGEAVGVALDCAGPGRSTSLVYSLMGHCALMLLSDAQRQTITHNNISLHIYTFLYIFIFIRYS